MIFPKVPKMVIPQICSSDCCPDILPMFLMLCLLGLVKNSCRFFCGIRNVVDGCSAKGPWNKSLSFIFPIKYGIPKSLKVTHWLSQLMVTLFQIIDGPMDNEPLFIEMTSRSPSRALWKKSATSMDLQTTGALQVVVFCWHKRNLVHGKIEEIKYINLLHVTLYQCIHASNCVYLSLVCIYPLSRSILYIVHLYTEWDAPHTHTHTWNLETTHLQYWQNK